MKKNKRKKARKDNPSEVRISLENVGKVELQILKKDGSVLANITCASPDDALEMLSSIMSLTAAK